MSKPEPIARECRFAIHLPTKSPDIPDLHLVKEVLHFEDGHTEPNVRWIKGYKRPFWVTKPNRRNHKQKKESEFVENLNRYECTESDLRIRASYALGKGGYGRDIRELAEDPYLYGTDLSSTVLIKKEYKKKWPDAASPYRTAFFDNETDVLSDSKDVIISTLISDDTLYTFVLRSFVKGYADPHAMYHKAMQQYIQKDLTELNLKSELRLFDTSVEIIQAVFEVLHRDKPDFLAIWNMDFDIPFILDLLKRNNVDAKHIFSDPSLPEHLRFCKYKKGSTKKVTASGQVKPKNPSEQWHSVYCPSSFYIIDAMCSYRFLRQGDQELPDYKLNTVLEIELGERKLDFDFAEGYVDLDWHVFMQKNYPFEYMCYAGYDVIGMAKTEKKTNDLSTALPIRSNYSDFANFSLSTKRFADDFGLWLMENRGKIPGTVPPRKDDADVDDESITDDDGDAATDEDYEENNDQDDTELYLDYSETLGLRHWIS